MQIAADSRYDFVARLLHWLVVALVAAQFVIGWTMPDVHRDTRPVGEIAWHLGVGTALVAAMVCRLLWRATHRPPPDDQTPFMRAVAALTHVGLYALLIAQPIAGWIATSAYRAPITVFGLFELPPIWPENRAFSEQLFYVHALLGIAIACLVAAHIGAAMYHHFVCRDRILLRMITG